MVPAGILLDAGHGVRLRRGYARGVAIARFPVARILRIPADDAQACIVLSCDRRQRTARESGAHVAYHLLDLCHLHLDHDSAHDILLRLSTAHSLT